MSPSATWTPQTHVLPSQGAKTKPANDLVLSKLSPIQTRHRRLQGPQKRNDNSYPSLPPGRHYAHRSVVRGRKNSHVQGALTTNISSDSLSIFLLLGCMRGGRKRMGQHRI